MTEPPRVTPHNTVRDADTGRYAASKGGPANRSGRRRRAKAGDLEALRREMWHAVRKVSDILDDPDADPGDTIRAANALAALGNAYRGVTETSVLEERLAALEAAVMEARP